MKRAFTTHELFDMLPKGTEVFITEKGKGYIESRDGRMVKIGQLNKKGLKNFKNYLKNEQLKTLKDISHYKRTDGTPCEGWIPDSEELKQEAIKWIKEDLCCCGALIGNGRKKEALILKENITKWMNRLNITEEDLK